ncbi:MAG: hypothetical protein KDJ75_08215 [Alphaproteobacteria bacterium]|nr:hypothetical protein [Alphaproteobacteria bacterium]
MKKAIFALAGALCILAAGPAHADDFFGKIDSIMNSVESTMNRADNTANRVNNTADRIDSKIPDRPDNAQQTPPPQAGTSRGQQAASNAEEERILERARQIEEERVLREAERIRAEREAQDAAASSPAAGDTRGYRRR